VGCGNGAPGDFGVECGGVVCITGGPMQRPLNILLIEDHDDSAVVMSRMLGKDGHFVTRAGTVAEARVLREVGKFELVITDRRLPDGDAWVMLAETEAGVPVVTVGGDGADAAGRPAGFKGHVQKPVGLVALRDAIARAMGG
jgi:DNA-binding NtrC family response regulator